MNSFYIFAESQIALNFLAHLYLSEAQEEVLLGNFIADGIKGKQLDRYSAGIQKGVRLHREIDRYTDSHRVFKQSMSRIIRNFSKYSAVVVDLYYDHFLAREWKHFTDEPLIKFVSEKYDLLIKYYRILPPRYNRILPYMVRYNWLLAYRELDGLHRVFQGMSRRAVFDSHMEDAVKVLKRHYSDLKADFMEFFPDIIQHIRKSS